MLITLEDAIHEKGLPASLIRCSMDSPIVAELRGEAVKVTAVLDRTAVYEPPGRDIAHDGRELVRRRDLLIDPASLIWNPDRDARRRARENGRATQAANAAAAGHRCTRCKGPLNRRNTRGLCTNCRHTCACGKAKNDDSVMCWQCRRAKTAEQAS